MSEKIVQLNEEIIKGQLKELVRGSVEETLNELLEKEAESLTQAARYERSEARQGYRSGHYDRNLTTTSGDVTLHMPRLKGVSFVVRCSNKCFFRLLGGYRYNHRGDERLSAPTASNHYRKTLPHISGKKEEPDGRLKPAKLRYRRHASNRPV